MSYTVLARRYRSRDFDELVGQEPIARTLRNAIASGRTAHAYLFCGTRGVGKTSMARIFARALNATPDLAEAQAIGEAILRGDDLDVLEIDGASNRGIQEARDLIAGAGLSPARCRYKIYIIDEVHMLTREAFNALLKTMEEPPAHVKFILCTTEAHKVPATIQSRCQRFDFRPLPVAAVAGQLSHILRKEGIEADEDVVVQVARLGQGSMRDALSLLDRLLAAGEERLTVALLEQMLGVPDHALVSGLVDAIAAGDSRSALERARQLLGAGSSETQVLELLAEHLRTLLIVATCGPQSDLLEVSADVREAAARQAAAFDAQGIVHLIALCDSVARSAQGSATARALLDATLVRLCMSEHMADIAALLRGEARAPVEPRAPVSARGPAAASVEAGAKKKDPRPPVAEAAAAPTAARAAASSLAEPKPEVPAGPAMSGEAIWEAVRRLAEGSSGDRARIDHLRYESLEAGVLRLSVDASGAPMARFLSSQSEKLADLVRRASGQRVRVAVDVARATASAAAPRLPEHTLEEARRLPAVAEAIELFDGTIVGVREEEGGRDV